LDQGWRAEAEPSREAERRAAYAVRLLDLARLAGYFRAPGRVRHLREDRELQPLHGRADFQALPKEAQRP
jgi:hypothetical protein